MDTLKYAYGYVRVSTDKQEELSPDSQKKLLQDYAVKNGIVLLEIFRELGVSGRHADKRPEFQRMIGMAKSQNILLMPSLSGNSAVLPETRKNLLCINHC